MKYLSVKNLEKHQHYKERRPPWIKLHQELLEDYEFARLHDASKLHLVCIWLLASRYENKIPYDAEWIARAIHANTPVDLAALVSAGFLVVSGEDDVASPALAERKQSATPEKERENREKPPLADANGSDARVSWPTRLALVWSNEVGAVKPGRMGKALKEAVDRHGEERVTRAMRAYITVQKSEGKPCNPSWFAGQAEVWISRTAEPPAVVDGQMNATLEMLTRPARSAA